MQMIERFEAIDEVQRFYHRGDIAAQGRQQQACAPFGERRGLSRICSVEVPVSHARMKRLERRLVSVFIRSRSRSDSTRTSIIIEFDTKHVLDPDKASGPYAGDANFFRGE